MAKDMYQSLSPFPREIRSWLILASAEREISFLDKLIFLEEEGKGFRRFGVNPSWLEQLERRIRKLFRGMDKFVKGI